MKKLAILVLAMSVFATGAVFAKTHKGEKKAKKAAAEHAAPATEKAPAAEEHKAH